MAEGFLEIALSWLSLDFIDKSTMIQITVSGNWPLSEPILTKFYIAIWHHKTPTRQGWTTYEDEFTSGTAILLLSYGFKVVSHYRCSTELIST